MLVFMHPMAVPTLGHHNSRLNPLGGPGILFRPYLFVGHAISFRAIERCDLEKVFSEPFEYDYIQ
jgi:hypothetical protein